MADIPEVLGRALRKSSPRPEKKTRRRAPKPNKELLRALGVRLQTLRRRLYPRLTQQAVAQQLGRSRYWLVQIERGTADPSYSQLCTMAELYGVEMSVLCDKNREV